MKLKLISTFVLALFFVSSFAQNKLTKEERLAKRKAFITERLALTDDEAKAFWPIYDQRRLDKQEKIKPLRKANKKGRKKIKEMSDDELISMLKTTMEIRKIGLKIDEEYLDKFLRVLPPKKVAKLYHIEKKFKQRGKQHKGKKGKR